MKPSEARNQHAAAFNEIETRIGQWQNEIDDHPSVTMIGAAIVREGGLDMLEVVTITDLLDETDEPVCVRFRALLQPGRLH